MTTSLNRQETRQDQQSLHFPAHFKWGASTAAFQIEGGADQRGESIWDRFCATPGKVVNGDTGLVACDHFHRWQSDIALMKSLNLQVYRFSVSWPRIIPDGTGQVSQAGLDFYDRLVDGLLEAGIAPYATLYHWDLPQTLQDAGGWANRQTAYAFADYAEQVARRLGDRIPAWTTLNEPWCSAFLGYELGVHAPGLTYRAQALRAVHHLLLAHGLAVPRLQQIAPQAEVGITLNFWPIDPSRPDHEADQEATRLADDEQNRLFVEPIFLGRYPESYLERVGGASLPIEEGDLGIIAAPLDFLGVNYYNRQVVQANPPGVPGWRLVEPAGTYTTMGWEVSPESFHRLLTRLWQAYRPAKIYITENGASGEEGPDATGQIHDNMRGYYIQEHLAQLHRAQTEGVPVEGYFTWSLLDNFEWAWGYSRRFGLVYVDFATQERIIKDSGHWYSQVIRQNSLPLGLWRL